MKEQQQKVNWKNEYELDNIFNIIIGLMIVALLFIEPITILIPTLVGLYINISARGFFNRRKFK